MLNTITPYWSKTKCNQAPHEYPCLNIAAHAHQYSAEASNNHQTSSTYHYVNFINPATLIKVVLYLDLFFANTIITPVCAIKSIKFMIFCITLNLM